MKNRIFWTLLSAGTFIALYISIRAGGYTVDELKIAFCYNDPEGNNWNCSGAAIFQRIISLDWRNVVSVLMGGFIAFWILVGINKLYTEYLHDDDEVG